MDHVLANIKGRSKKKIFKLLSDQTLFDNIDITIDACVEYNPDHNLDEDSWFEIEKFSEKPYCINLLKTPFDSKGYDDLPTDKFTKIIYLCAIQSDNFYFQKITSSLFIGKKMISFGEIAQIENNNNRLVINTQPDAIYLKESDALVFRNLATISSIFKGIDVLYKEATHEEVEKFLNEEFIKLSGNYGINNVSKPNRKRIALAIATFEKIEQQEKHQILDYINDYCSKIPYNAKEKSFVIKSDDDLKHLLYGIEQRFYTTPIGEEKRLANSIQTMK